MGDDRVKVVVSRVSLTLRVIGDRSRRAAVQQESTGTLPRYPSHSSLCTANCMRWNEFSVLTSPSPSS